jgi:hypothetical protein
MATPSTASAATSAADSSTDPVDLVNSPAGYPVQEIWPGAVDASQYTDPGDIPPGAPAGPPYGSWGAEPFTETLPEQAPGGGYQDTSWMTGHDAPQAAWDSSAGEPFAPSGAVDPLLHAEDTGAVFVHEYVVPAEIGKLTRRTAAGQTYNEVAPTQTEIGQTTPNGRTNLDQQQWHDPDGFNPWEIPYSERPIQNNLAYEAVATSSDGGYGVAGALSDRSVYDYAAVAYESPPDPDVSVAPVGTSGDSGIGGGWV